jgi:hypothetical protein
MDHAQLEALFEDGKRSGLAQGRMEARDEALVEMTRLRERVRELEDSIRLDDAERDVAMSYGRNKEAEAIAQEIRSRRGEEWPGVVLPAAVTKTSQWLPCRVCGSPVVIGSFCDVCAERDRVRSQPAPPAQPLAEDESGRYVDRGASHHKHVLSCVAALWEQHPEHSFCDLVDGYVIAIGTMACHVSDEDVIKSCATGKRM